MPHTKPMNWSMIMIMMITMIIVSMILNYFK